MRWSEIPQGDKAEAALLLLIYIPLTAILVLQLLSQHFRVRHRAHARRHRGSPKQNLRLYKRHFDGAIPRVLRLTMLLASLLQLLRLVRLAGRQGAVLLVAELARNWTTSLLLVSYLYTGYVTGTVAYKSRGVARPCTFRSMFYVTVFLSVVIPTAVTVAEFELNRVHVRAITLGYYAALETMWVVYICFFIYMRLRKLLRIEESVKGTSQDPLVSLRKFLVVTFFVWAVAAPSQIVRMVGYINDKDGELASSPEDAEYDAREGISVLVQTIATLSLSYYASAPFTILRCERRRGLAGTTRSLACLSTGSTYLRPSHEDPSSHSGTTQELSSAV